jgi:SIR2-like domain
MVLNRSPRPGKSAAPTTRNRRKRTPASTTPPPAGSTPPAVEVPPEPLSRSPTQAAFERLVDAVLSRRALPFVGAGVSQSAEFTDPSALGPPTTAGLTALLSQELFQRARDSHPARSTLEVALGRSFEKAQDLEALGLSWLAEQFVQLDPDEHLALCRLLKVERFKHLRPTLAHRYLAFLTRERLVPEVITTNYDCCLEIAFEESLAPHLPPRTDTGERAACHLVTDNETNQDRVVDGEPALTIYKINGCAGSYNDDPGAARRIALTDMDLQNWHGEGWAKRVFEERLSQKSAILTGFGGDEAQVRFAITALCKELRAAARKAAPGQAAAQSTAPFVQEYKKTPTRFQQQILYAWFAASTEDAERQKLSRDERIAALYANAFTAAHHTFFRDEPSGLTADRFWEALFMAVWWELLARQTTVGETASFLRAAGLALPRPPQDLLEALFEGNHERCQRCSLLVLAPSPPDGQAALPLLRWIEALRPHVEHNGAASRYVAMRDQPLLIGLLMLFLAWSHRDGRPVADSPEIDPRLGVRLHQSDPRRPEIWLTGFSSADLELDGPSRAGKALEFLQIALFTDGTSYQPPAVNPGTWPLRYTGVTSDGRDYARHGQRVDVYLLFHLAAEQLNASPPVPYPVAWTELCNVLDTLIDQRFAIYFDYRPSFRDRTSELEAH